MSYGEYLHFNVTLLKMAGFYKISNTENTLSSKIRSYLMRFFCNLVLICVLVSVCTEIKVRGVLEFSENALGYAYVGAASCAFQRAIYYCAFDRKCEKLVQEMNNFFKYKTRTLLKEKCMQSRLKLADRLTFVWVIYAQLFALLYCTIPMFSMKQNSRTLPLPMWTPFDWKESPIYEITYFIQVLTFLIVAYVQTIMDMFFVSVILLTSKQFELLGWELNNLLFTNLMAINVPEEMVCKFREEFNMQGRNVKETYFTLVHYLCNTEKFSNEISKRIKELISFHQTLMSFCACLEDFFSPIMLLYYFNLMVTSLFMNFMIVMSNDISSIALCFPLCIAVYFDMFFVCFTANILTNEAEKLQADTYEMQWYMCHEKFKSSFKFLLQNVNLPVTLTLGKFFPLGLPLFLWGVKTINSYMIILYQVTHAK